jgi:pimeloyl-ACP methyl ester carboxylesterase
MTRVPIDTAFQDDSGELTLAVVRRVTRGRPVLYVHGATFPAALSVGYRFGGRSWMDDLEARGFDVWAFDFAGYGRSQRYAEETRPGFVPGRAQDAVRQLARIVDLIVRVTGEQRVSLIAHSWGSIVAGLFAARHPERIDKLCFFGPVLERQAVAQAVSGPDGPWLYVTVDQQLARFVEDVPKGHAPVLIEPALEQWGPAYLASDPGANLRLPPAVKIPCGRSVDLKAAWSGKLAYQPKQIRNPTLVVRGEWDHVSTGDDARWLLSRVSTDVKRDVAIPKGTHLMHLERSREGLFAAVGEFLATA